MLGLQTPETIKLCRDKSFILGTVFEIGSRRMEIYAVHHARATIQWLKASKDNSVQAEMLLKNIYVH